MILFFIYGIILGFIVCALNALLLIYFVTKHTQSIQRLVQTAERQIKGKAVIYEPDEDVERFQSSLKKVEDDTLLSDL